MLDWLTTVGCRWELAVRQELLFGREVVTRLITGVQGTEHDRNLRKAQQLTARASIVLTYQTA
tara:strand:+ start:365 stop:553 length:189 start_codon:yes stop_codon:yes gene_type:complete